MSYTFNPVYDFVNNDSRYASFVTTCNEWRVAKAAMKLMPSSIPQADMTHGINMLAVTCSDRQSDYKSGSSAVIPYLKIMSVPDSKCKMM